MRGIATRGNKLAYGDFGIVATEPSWIKSNQIEAARVAMTRYTKRTGKVWIKIFPDKPVTKKPAETRMGSGKGAPEFWVAVVKPGRILFEIKGVTEVVAREAFRLAAHKLPCKTKFIKKDDEVVTSNKTKNLEETEELKNAEIEAEEKIEADVEATEITEKAETEKPVKKTVKTTKTTKSENKTEKEKITDKSEVAGK